MANNRVKFFRDRIRRAVNSKDNDGVLNAVAELAKDPDLMGEVISGDEAMDMPDHAGGSHHVTINVHGGASGEKKTDDEADAPAGVDPAAADPAGGGDIASQLAALSSRMDQIEQVIAMLADEEEGEGESEPDPDSDTTAPEPDDDKKKFGDRATGDRAMVGDSTSMRDGFQRMLSQAEILMPGIQLMTFDSAQPARTTFDAMCSFRRKTLEASKSTERGKSAISAVMEGKLPKSFHDASMTCDAVGAVFNAAAGVIASQNQGRATQPHFGPDGTRNGFSTKVVTPAELNKRNAERWANR